MRLCLGSHKEIGKMGERGGEEEKGRQQRVRKGR